MYTLPITYSGVIQSLSKLSSKVKGIFGSRRIKYRLATVLDLILIAVILIYGRQPAQGLVSPVVSSFQSTYTLAQNRATSESFAFVPDLARNKFPDIDLTGLTYLSFFDAPLTEEGEINYSSRGYSSFSSAEAQELFDRARSQNTKVFLTLSALDERIIQNLLNNQDAQKKLADQAIEEIRNSGIEGITIDFEYPKGRGKDYQDKFSDFISLLKKRIYSALPQAQVAVAIPSALTNNESIYNVGELGKVSDRLFIIASNMIVPETKNAIPANPVFGYNANEYWAGLSGLLNNLIKKTPVDKLVMERAWYGNGHNYPLYTPKSTAKPESSKEPDGIDLDHNTVEKLVSGVPDKGKESARKNIPLIAKALDREGILDSNVLAYALATVEHETADTFEPIEEIQGAVNARRLGYEGGANYFGRGFIQITHLRNYRTIGERIGLGDKLVKEPGLASHPEISAKILAAYFKDNNVANLASQGYFVAARNPINPDYNGYSVAQMALKYDIYR